MEIQVRSAPHRHPTLTTVDGVVILVAVFALVWTLNLQLRDPATSGVSAYASWLFPAADSLVAMEIVRMASRTRTAAVSYLAGLCGAGALVVSDLVALTEPVGSDRRLATACLYVTLTLFGVAVTHPSMGQLAGLDRGWADDLGSIRLGVLGVAVVLPPTLMVLVGPDVNVLTAMGLVVAAGTNVALVLIRLSGILSDGERQSDRLRALARSDHLTRLPNRRTVDAELEYSVAEAAASGRPLVVSIVDLDRFKAYNDARGHAAGDRLLRELAARLRGLLPTDVFLGRYGGEEFLVIVRGRPLAQAARLVDEARVGAADVAPFSAGVAAWDGLEDTPLLLVRADRALYAAKAAGRARVHVVEVPSAHPLPVAPAAASS